VLCLFHVSILQPSVQPCYSTVQYTSACCCVALAAGSMYVWPHDLPLPANQKGCGPGAVTVLTMTQPLLASLLRLGICMWMG
jgi:hypothetical protein